MNQIKLLILVISIGTFISSYGQNKQKLDSLFTVLKTAKADTTRVNAYADLCWEYKNSNLDTALYFGNLGLNLAIEANYKKGIAKCYNGIGSVHCNHGSYDKSIEYYLKSLKINEELLDKKGMAGCFRNIGIVRYYQGSYDKAIEYFLKSLKIFEELQDKKGISQCYSNIGSIHNCQGRYDKAIEYYLKSLKINEELKDKDGMADCYINIGVVHIEQGSYDKAIEYYLKSLKINEELKDKKGMAYCYNNIGIVHENQGIYDKAIEYFLKCSKVFEELQDKNGLAACYINIGNVHKIQCSYDKAIEYYLKSLKINEELKDKNGIAAVYANIADLYIRQDDSLERQGANGREVRLRAVLEYGQKSMTIAKEIKSAEVIYKVAGTILKAYKRLGNYKKALEYAEIFIATKDSMFNEEKTKALAKMGAQYEAEKRELTIQKLEKEKLLQNETIARKEAESKKQRILIFSFLAGFIMILVFSVFLYRLFLQKKKANVIIARKNQSLEIAFAEINTQKEEITAQRDEIVTQRDKIEGQRNNLQELNTKLADKNEELEFLFDLATERKKTVEKQNKDIQDSIRYAERIQQAVLPTGEFAVKILGEHFILFKPKDIVSGDFYWGTRINEWLIFTVADCTGHGVPGAFMSMLGVSFLNEIVRKKEVTKASYVLDHLRESVVDALQQKGTFDEQKDGMDMAICALNTTSKLLQFAGAGNPLYMILNNSNGQLTEIKGDKMPIGIHDRMDHFTNHEMQLNKGDILYMSSDGYRDQFGGPKADKIMSKNLKRILSENCNKSMTEQKEILDKIIEDWKNGYEEKFEQTDDITVMGIKI